MFPSWWRNLVKLTHRNGKASRRGRRSRTHLRPNWRPVVEQFEDRLVPTTLTNASDDAFRLSSARYQRGVDTYLNVLIAQRTLYSARQTLVASQLAKQTNLVTLYTALGGGLNAPRPSG